jgi:hypothetical protein
MVLGKRTARRSDNPTSLIPIAHHRPSITIDKQQQKPLTIHLIDALYHLIRLVIARLILVLWK